MYSCSKPSPTNHFALPPPFVVHVLRSINAQDGTTEDDLKVLSGKVRSMSDMLNAKSFHVCKIEVLVIPSYGSTVNNDR